jgi:hypothetical protein
MNSSVVEVRPALARGLEISDDTLVVDLTDGRTLSVPLAWYPRLAYGTSAQRSKWRLIGRGEGIHWPELDEDISVEGLLAGQPSGESRSSLQKWLKSRGLVAGKRMQPTIRAKRLKRRTRRPHPVRG